MNTTIQSEIRSRADYQHFDLMPDGGVTNVRGRMACKLQAMDDLLPTDLHGKSVLDIGCDFGFWSFWAAERGARVLGLDRSREVRGIGHVDLPALNNAASDACGSPAGFMHYDAGRQYHDLGKHDLVLVMSVYHHIYQNTGDHQAIWYWLWNSTRERLLFEAPLDTSDTVVRMNVHPALQPAYTREAITAAATRYFTIEDERPALHEDTRVIWRLTPKPYDIRRYEGRAVSGAGGASKAFQYAGGRRREEIRYITGMNPIPGSLNVSLSEAWDWDSCYYRAGVLDVVDRSAGLDGQWALRAARIYPVSCGGIPAYAFRFEGEGYPPDFIELISCAKLDPRPDMESVTLWQSRPT